jgi:hypothetical protein
MQDLTPSLRLRGNGDVGYARFAACINSRFQT